MWHLQRKSKFNSQKTNGFPSKLESDLYEILKKLEEQGQIKELRRQDNVHLTKAKILYIPDFSFYEDDKKIFAEAKGIETDVWRIKRRLWKCYGPAELRIYKRRGKTDVYLSETIVPEQD